MNKEIIYRIFVFIFLIVLTNLPIMFKSFFQTIVLTLPVIYLFIISSDLIDFSYRIPTYRGKVDSRYKSLLNLQEWVEKTKLRKFLFSTIGFNIIFLNYIIIVYDIYKIKEYNIAVYINMTVVVIINYIRKYQLKLRLKNFYKKVTNEIISGLNNSN
ncbi:MAG: hypothetical protein ACOC1K_04295 [Nanoarchaeota archaeon]